MTDFTDIEGFLTHVSESFPAGADLRDDVSPSSPYFLLRDARSEARAFERQVDAGGTGLHDVTSRWNAVQTTALEALRSTRDLEVAAWLLESLVRSDGLIGLTAGARLLDGLLDRFWDAGLHPGLDEDGPGARLAPIAGLSGQSGEGTLLQPLRKLVLFERRDGTPLVLWVFEQAEAVHASTDHERKQQRIDAGVPVFDEVEMEARSVGTPFLARMQAEASSALEAWIALGATLDRLAGTSSPSTKRVADCLRLMIRITSRYLPTPAAPIVGLEPDTETSPGAIVAGPPNRLRAGEDRAEMLDQLRRIAAFFRRTEPNSPLSDTIDEAVRRSNLSWRELLSELIPEVEFRDVVLTRVGLPPLSHGRET